MEIMRIENGVKMTSRDIAELTGKEHKNVMADIRKEAENLDNVGINSSLNFKLSNYISDRGKEYPQYLLSKDGVMMLAMKYDTITRYKITQKLNELENKNKNSPALPQNYLEALKQLVISEEKRIEAEKTNAILMHVNKNYTVTEIAKELNLKSATELNKILADKKIQYKSNGTWVLYSKYSNNGYFDIKQEVLETGKVIYHRKVTQLGRKFIIDLLGDDLIGKNY